VRPETIRRWHRALVARLGLIRIGRRAGPQPTPICGR
jgi:hypothetical protein